ncbi:SUKH-4 family immunity protein [Streptomyces sp. NPDC002825]|uniref:SUKH-4 family immunity protein n=1 Tax=Streptomyces sp. NPDC002825 TaxID=3154666 RepID=UPI00332C2E02
MVTFAQAQERAEEWINGDLPSYQHREVRVREFELGFVVWAEDREGGPTSDGGRQRLVIARTGEATLWPGLPVGEVIRRYEEEYGATDEVPAQAAVPAARIDLNQTSFLLSPPEWLQDAADKIGLPREESHASQESGGASASVDDVSEPVGAVTPSASASVASSADSDAVGSPAAVSSSAAPASVPVAAPAVEPVSAPEYEPTAMDGVPAEPAAPVPAEAPVPSAPAPAPAAASGSPWADANASSGGADGAVPLPATVFAPPLSGTDDEDTPAPVVGADAPTALMKGGSALPPTAIAPRLDPNAPAPGAVPPAPPTPPAPQPSPAPAPAPAAASAPASAQAGPGAPTPPPPAPSAPGAGDIADAATSKAALPPKAGRGPTPPPPPGVPGVPGGSSGSNAYIPTQLVSQLGPEGLQPPAQPGPPGPPPAPAAPGPVTPPQPVHHAATMLAHPNQGGPGAPPPPPPPPGVPGGTPAGGIAHAATMLAQPGPGGLGGPGGPPPPPAPAPPVGGHTPPPAPGPVPPGGPVPPAYGYPQPTGQPTVGPGYQAVLRYRAPDGSETQIIRRSAPGTPHPEWQILHELRAMNVPPQQVLELHTELESCELPGGYCARMIRETWPQARITSIAPYGRDHAGRQQGMRQLLTHQGELHQVADGPARPAPVRAPLPQVQPAPPVPPEGIAQELAGAFGPGILRFDQRAVSRQGVPEMVARTLVWAGLPADFGPFFWAQPAVPVVPTLAELAAQRQVPAAPDASSYLVLGSDFGRAICVQYGTAHIVAVPVEAGPGGQSVPPQFVNTGLPEFTRAMALLGRMWRLRFGLNPEQAGRWTVDFQAQLAMLDPAALSSPENWWSVLLEQMWDGLL